MSKQFDLNESINFIEQEMAFYSDWELDYIKDALITYLEHAACSNSNEEFGLYMTAALTFAHLFNYSRGGKYYRCEKAKKNMTIEDKIVHYALKLAEADFNYGPDDERRDMYSYDLFDNLRDYISLKDSLTDGCERH